jgi:hypothetical protein
MQKVVTLTKSQISTASALIATLKEELKKTEEEQRRLEAELATRRQSLREWTRSRDSVSRAYQCLNSGVQPPPHVAHIRERVDNPTATPSDDELARRLDEQDSNDINAILISMETRESTISILRSRIAVLEEDIAGCKRVSSHTKSMILLQASHKGQLQALLAQYKSRPPLSIGLQSTVVQEEETLRPRSLLNAQSTLLHQLFATNPQNLAS